MGRFAGEGAVLRAELLGRRETNWAGAGNWAVVGSGLGRKRKVGLPPVSLVLVLITGAGGLQARERRGWAAGRRDKRGSGLGRIGLVWVLGFGPD